MAAVVDAWKKSSGALSPNALGRAVGLDVVKRFAALAKQYVEGMNAQGDSTGSSWNGTLGTLASGGCDG